MIWLVDPITKKKIDQTQRVKEKKINSKCSAFYFKMNLLRLPRSQFADQVHQTLQIR